MRFGHRFDPLLMPDLLALIAFFLMLFALVEALR